MSYSYINIKHFFSQGIFLRAQLTANENGDFREQFFRVLHTLCPGNQIEYALIVWKRNAKARPCVVPLELCLTKFRREKAAYIKTTSKTRFIHLDEINTEYYCWMI